jgi:hypothetical protein
MNSEEVKFGIIANIHFRDFSSSLVHPKTMKIAIAAL